MPRPARALGRITRAKLAHSVVQNSGPLLETLAKKYDLQYYSFDRNLTQLSVNPVKPDLPEPPNPGGNATRWGDALTRLLEEAAGRQVPEWCCSPMVRTLAAARPSRRHRQPGAAKTPVFTVPVGSSTRLRDIALVDVFTTGLVSVGDTARVAVTLESQGFDKRPVKVELKDGDKLLDSKDLILNSAEQQQWS